MGAETLCLVVAALLLATSLGALVGYRTADTHWRAKYEWRRLHPWDPPAAKPAPADGVPAVAPGDLDGARRAYGRAAIAAMREEWRRRREGDRA